MFRDKKLEVCFPSCVWVQEVAEHERLNAELLTQIRAIQPAEMPAGFGQSRDDLHKRDGFQPFVKLAEAAANEILNFLKIEREGVYLTDCWANIYAEGGAIHQHTHPNNFLSGVYYVSAPERCGDLKFHDPRPQVNVLAPDPTEKTMFNSASFFIKPLPGRMVLFQSWLPHSTLHNRSGADRISISFNVMLRGHIGFSMAHAEL